jgi:hypothetical protein
MLHVQLGINSARDVWKFAKLDSPRRLVSFWQHFQTSLVLLIPYCIRHRMITYPGDLTASKMTGTSNRIEIHFRTFNHLSRPDSFVKLFETLCLCLAQGSQCPYSF